MAEPVQPDAAASQGGGLRGSAMELTLAARQLFHDAEALSRYEEHEGALEAFRQARNAFALAGCGADVAFCDLGEARMLQALGRMAEAVGPLSRALSGLPAANQRFLTAEATDRLAASLAAAGRLEEAAALHLEAAERFAAIGQHRLAARCEERAEQVRSSGA